MTIQPLKIVAETGGRTSSWSSLGVRMHFAAGEEVYAQEEEADLFYQVVEGAVRTTRVLSDGRRQIGDFYYSGDLFGFEASPEHRFSAEALNDCHILVVRRAAVGQAGEAGDRFERRV